MNRLRHVAETSGSPPVWLVGDYEHADFNEVVALLRIEAELTVGEMDVACPELIVVAQSRPGVVGRRELNRWRRRAPLAGVAWLLGSWCEGQGRTGRPLEDALRLYWHEFEPWWRQQLALRAAGRCPDWARRENARFRSPSPSPLCQGLPSAASRASGAQHSVRGSVPSITFPCAAYRSVVVLCTPRWETADALGDVLQRSGWAAIWQPPGRELPTVRGLAAGVWEGGQLDPRELDDLTKFSRRLAVHHAPVVTLLDFPRRDRCALARQAGAAAVLGKPWCNADLVSMIDLVTRRQIHVSAS